MQTHFNEGSNSTDPFSSERIEGHKQTSVIGEKADMAPNMESKEIKDDFNIGAVQQFTTGSNLTN